MATIHSGEPSAGFEAAALRRWRHVPAAVVRAVLASGRPAHSDDDGGEGVTDTAALRELQLAMRHDPRLPAAVRAAGGRLAADVRARAVAAAATREHWDHQRPDAQHWDGVDGVVARVVLDCAVPPPDASGGDSDDEGVPSPFDRGYRETPVAGAASAAPALGEAHGATEAEALRRAAADALLRYYLGPPSEAADP